METVAVIGAGMAGLACADALAGAGLAVTVLDKGRSVGGRLATRRSPAGSFDHGAPQVAATGAFAAWIAGHALRWNGGWIGAPGMSALVRPLARRVRVHQGAEVQALVRRGDGWHLTGTGLPAPGPFDRLVIAIPPEQALRLAGDLVPRIAMAAMRPVWTAMAAFETPLPPSPLDPDGPVALALRENDKPGREGSLDRWVIHAGAAWTAGHLDLDKPEAAALLLDAFFAATGTAPRAALHLEGHRWRFGLTARPLGQPFLLDEGAGLGLCGDWCLGAGAQEAFDSGRALARAMTGQPV